MLQRFGKIISKVGVWYYHDKLEYKLLVDTSELPYGTPIDKLIAEFKLKSYVSFWYVLHNMNSRFVTYRKANNDNNIADGRM